MKLRSILHQLKKIAESNKKMLKRYLRYLQHWLLVTDKRQSKKEQTVRKRVCQLKENNMEARVQERVK